MSEPIEKLILYPLNLCNKLCNKKLFIVIVFSTHKFSRMRAIAETMQFDGKKADKTPDKIPKMDPKIIPLSELG